ncbi:MAG: murein biosynthesis integral membrane protein MurJ [Pseudomonadota bacterium]
MLRNFLTVGSATLLSRLLGFIRDILMAAAIGIGPVADAFVVAFRFPNLFRRLFAEGAFNSAFIPLFARELEGEDELAKRRAAAKQFAEEALSGLLLILTGVCGACMVAMPLLMLGLAPGFIDDSAKFDLAVLLTRITMPYLVLVSLLALISGVLNGLGRFAAAAFAPVMLNVVLIGVLAAIVALDLTGSNDAGRFLAYGVLAGGVAQLLLVVLDVQRAGFVLKIRLPVWNHRMKRLVSLGIPGVIAGGITQINIVVGTMIASLQDGAVSLLYYADRLYQLPLGVVGIAIGVVLLPDLAKKLKSADQAGVEIAQSRSLEFSMLLTLPASIALATIPVPLVTVLFERGAFSPEATLGTAAALQAFAAGLPAFVLIKVFSPSFFAREDTKTPMKVGAVSVAINIVTSLSLFPFFGHVGIAIATSVAGWVNALLLYRVMVNRGYWRLKRNHLQSLVRMLAAAAAMGIILIVISGYLSSSFGPNSPLLEQTFALAALVAAGLASFFLLAQLFGAVHLRDLRAMVARS